MRRRHHWMIKFLEYFFGMEIHQQNQKNHAESDDIQILIEFKGN